MVSTLAISCVFTSVVCFEGPAKFLFTPLGLAVVFAMLASYALSRTLTPIIIGLLLKGEHHAPPDDAPTNWFARFHGAFERAFEQMREGYARLLRALLEHRLAVPAVAFLILALAAAMRMLVVRDFFPSIHGGLFKLHVHAPAATRIVATDPLFPTDEAYNRQV